jgi:hypothetical protein
MIRRGVQALALTGAAVASLAACGGGSKSHSSTSTTLALPAPTLPHGVTGDTALPSNIPNNPQLRGNVQIASGTAGCKAAPGGWEATGTAINPSDKDITYEVTVFFTTTSATVIDAGHTDVKVKAHGSSPWTVSDKFNAAPQMLCVLRGVGLAPS